MSQRVATLTMTEKPHSGATCHGQWPQGYGPLTVFLIVAAIIAVLYARWRVVSRRAGGFVHPRLLWDVWFPEPQLRTTPLGGAGGPTRHRVRVLGPTRPAIVVVRPAARANRLCPFCALPLDGVDHSACQRGEFDD